MELVSVIIPSRNEKYLHKTISDCLAKAKENIEVIVILDGYWEDPENLVEDDRVSYIHFVSPRGMRASINAGVAVSRGKYILKIDAHVLMQEGYDAVLKKDCNSDWVVVPRRYALDPEKWAIEKRDDRKYPIDYMYLSRSLHGTMWKERDTANKDKMIDITMSSQGSCWFMHKTYYEFLELLDESKYGTFWNEFQEIGLKCWLSGGKVVVNKQTSYAHWHKPDTRGYKLPPGEKEKTMEMVKRWTTQKMFSKQIHNIQWLVDQFAPVPLW